MNQKEFISYLSESFECSKEAAEAIIKIFAEGVSLAISEGHNVNIETLGKFAIATVPAREIKVPNGSSIVTVARRHRPYFTPAKDLKVCCNF